MLASDIVSFLSVNNLGTLGIDIFISEMPTEPNNLITISEYDGDGSQNNNDLTRRLQIAVRNTSFQAAYEKAWDVFNLLDNPENRVKILNGRKCWLKAIQQPIKLYSDESNRIIYGFNIEIKTTREGN